MILCKTPLRISFIGGGTDLPEFYVRHTGYVLSATIDLHITILVRPSNKFRVLSNFCQCEVTDNNDIPDSRIRAIIKFFSIVDPIEIVISSPSSGQGLGRSSALVVGLLNALSAYHGEQMSQRQLAECAFVVERDMVGDRLGKQDHYAAAYGGFNLFKFERDSVEVFGLDIEPLRRIQPFCHLLDTGIHRNSRDILSDQSARDNDDILLKMAHDTFSTYSNMTKTLISSDAGLFKREMEVAVGVDWLLKKQLSPLIEQGLEEMLRVLEESGGRAFKVCGAGHGGTIFVMSPEAPNISNPIPFDFESEGSHIILNTAQKYRASVRGIRP